MTVATGIPVAEYLHTCYRPDVDYLEGCLVERNMGDFPHARLQSQIIFRVKTGLAAGVLPYDAIAELRVQVRPERFRVPDVVLYAGTPPPLGYLTEPPAACIEILSKDDRMSDIEDRVEDYLAFGVPVVWVIDPYSRRAWHYTREERTGVKDGILRGPGIELSLADLFPA